MGRIYRWCVARHRSRNREKERREKGNERGVRMIVKMKSGKKVEVEDDLFDFGDFLPDIQVSAEEKTMFRVRK